jgi:hypothetical protein
MIGDLRVEADAIAGGGAEGVAAGLQPFEADE